MHYYVPFRRLKKNIPLIPYSTDSTENKWKYLKDSLI